MVAWHSVAYSLGTGGTLAFGRLLLHYCLGLVQVCGQLRDQRYSLAVYFTVLSVFMAWLVYHVL